MFFRLIVGLGNVGDRYDGTRHNVGFYVLDALASKKDLSWAYDEKREAFVSKFVYGGFSIVLAKPTTLMNGSGSAVAKLCHFYKIHPTDVIVVYDDIAFDVGDFRMTSSEGTGGHNGVADVLNKIGGGFVRLRVGIGQKPIKQMDLKDHVISKFSQEEIDILDKIMHEIFSCLKLLLDKGIEYTMNFANRKKPYGRG